MAVPAETAVTTPVEDATVATAGLPLLHVPPAGVPAYAVEAPSHTLVAPDICANDRRANIVSSMKRKLNLM